MVLSLKVLELTLKLSFDESERKPSHRVLPPRSHLARFKSVVEMVIVSSVMQIQPGLGASDVVVIISLAVLQLLT